MILPGVLIHLGYMFYLKHFSISHRKGILKHTVAGKVEGGDRSDGKTRKKSKQVLDGLRETRG
jgi:hypothetical protein